MSLNLLELSNGLAELSSALAVHGKYRTGSPGGPESQSRTNLHSEVQLSFGHVLDVLNSYGSFGSLLATCRAMLGTEDHETVGGTPGVLHRR